MITEKVEIKIDPDRSSEFIVAIHRGLNILRSAKNAVSASCFQGVERPDTYFLLIEWQSIDDHVAFTKTEQFADFRDLIGSFYLTKPVMEHMRIV